MTYADTTTDRPPEWSQSLFNGAAGIALLHVARARAGLAGWDTAHQWVAEMTSSPVVADPSACGLFRGAPAVAFVLRMAQHPAYARPLAILDHHIVSLTRRRLDQARERIRRGQPPALREFDLVNGLTGIGVCLLQAQHVELLADVLSYLVRLTMPVTMDGHRLPGWWTSNGPQDRPSPTWPGGHGNLGVAHGIAGPLALLAIAMRHRFAVPGQDDAIGRICTELDRWRCGAPGRWWWPGVLAPTEQHTGIVQQPGPQRPSWCYGTPGLARAQQLAALAMGDQRRQHEAESALAGCVADQRQLTQLGEAGVCHGWAGVIQIARRAAADAGPDTALAALLPDLKETFEQRHGLGPSVGDGLLEGATGIALTRDCSIDVPWDACLLNTSPTPEIPQTEGIG